MLENKVLQQLSNCTTREVIEILDEVFSRRMAFSEHIKKHSRWFVVSYSGSISPDKGGFIVDPEDPVEVEYLAQPLTTLYENESYFEQGVCNNCGLIITCTHKYAKCPYCFSCVGCS